MNKKDFLNKYLFKAMGVVVLLASFGGFWVITGIQTFAISPLDIGKEGMNYIIKPGQNLKMVARDLYNMGVINDPDYLVWLARWEGRANTIRVGEYKLEPGITAVEFLDKLVAGKVIEYSLTLVEGWNFRQMIDAVNSDEYLIHDLKGVDQEQIMQKLGWPGQHPEGRFYPDTYHFSRGITDIAFLQRAYRAMQGRLQQEWETRAVGLPYKTPYEALIMASIVEKETALPEERQAIAGVFVRRLEKRMRLQTDPTVIYGMGEAYKGNIRSRDLKRDTPYNTYRRTGLPPTPIAMPGGASIHAALHPGDGGALYFVSRGDGSHHFSATLDEHNQAVIKYQLKGKKKAFSSMPAKKK